MDEEIIKTVESVLGKNIKIVDCETTSTIHEEEIVLINGIEVKLNGTEGAAIKSALMTGQVPPCDLLNQLLFQAGILHKSVRVDTSLSVKSTLTTKEEVTVARDGCVLDERLNEIKENNFYTSSSTEIWEPIKKPTITKITETSDVKSALFPSMSSTNYNRKIPNNNYNQENDYKIDCNAIGNDIKYHVIPNTSVTRINTASTISFDSGNDDSIATGTTTTTTTNRKNHPYCLPSSRTQTLDSVSSLCDFLSSDEIDFIDPCCIKTQNQNAGINFILTKGHPQQYQDNILAYQPSQFSLSIDHHDLPSSSDRKYQNLSGQELNKLKSQPNCIISGSGSGSASGNYSDLDFTNSTECNEFEDNTLIYRDGSLISGSLDALIQHMVPTGQYYPDKSYLFAFLLSARLFIKPHQLLSRICVIGDIQQNFSTIAMSLWKKQQSSSSAVGIDVTDDINFKAMKITEPSSSASSSSLSVNKTLDSMLFAKNLIKLLSEWIEIFPYDFRDERLMHSIKEITQKCIMIDKTLRKNVSILLQNLLIRLTALDKYELFLEHINIDKNLSMKKVSSNDHHQHFMENSFSSSSSSSSAAAPSATTTASASSTSTQPPPTFYYIFSSHDIIDICANPTILAHQLTHIELERLSYIGPEEFVQAFTKENNFDISTFNDNQHQSSDNDVKKTRNLETYVKWFNRLNFLVATEIIKYPKKKQRVRIVEYWIETARECFNIGNFNSLMAILAGLNMSPISRLKKTWAKVQLAKFSILEHQMDPSSNFSSYRSTLKAAMWRSAGATDERQRIVIPFFSLLVKDLYFLNEGCSNKLRNGHVNFEKFWQLSKQVQEFIEWKQVKCPFEKNNNIIMFLQMNPILNENTLALASFECEPPDNNQEKDRYKMLKAEQQQQHK